jgi:hypothetical protein
MSLSLLAQMVDELAKQRDDLRRQLRAQREAGDALAAAIRDNDPLVLDDDPLNVALDAWEDQ